MDANTPAQRSLAAALTALKLLQDAGRNVIHSEELDRSSREALTKNGFLRPVIKGWYMPSRPDEENGETTAWYASAMEFVARYCTARFDAEWCVSPDYSIRLLSGNLSIPRQVVVHAPKGQNNPSQLPSKHSILDYRVAALPSKQHLTSVNGIRAMSLEYALTRVPDSFFQTFAADAQVALTGLRDASGLTRILLEASQPLVAGRLAGALRACRRDAMADEIMSAMKSVGHELTETNPFLVPLPNLSANRGESPYVTRIRLMWQQMRGDVIAEFPPEPGLPDDPEAYMSEVRDAYVRDAYNSLSIEGYRVTTDLIERVTSGNWSPEGNSEDRRSRDAMAARGYFLSRQAVEESIRRIQIGENSGLVLSRDHRIWFRELFSPSVDAGILKASDLAGYRGSQVFIKSAAHVPPSPDSVRDMMPALFDLLEAEDNAAVRAVLGHFVFVFIHPYMDGNGRLGRFVMNTMLASGGYPWTIIEVTRRTEYMMALDAASSKGDIVPFARLIASCLADQHEKPAPTSPSRHRH